LYFKRRITYDMYNAYFSGYADSGRLMNIAETLGPNASQAWERSVVNQFTRNGVLWAVRS
jgi:multiple sugar transport system substrate-binding protein